MDDRLAPLQAHCIKGGYVSVPNGWIPLVVALHNKIAHVVPDYQIMQAKEKFGGLRYYVENIPEGVVGGIVSDLIYSAESRSMSFCQVCGKPGKPRSYDGWYETLCDTHHAEAQRG